MNQAWNVQLLKAIASVLTAVAMTIFIGGFLGYPVDPEKSRAVEAEVEQFHREHPVMPSEELDAFYAELEAKYAGGPEPPHSAVAIHEWHHLLLGLVLFASFLAFRPGLVPALVASSAAIGLAYWFLDAPTAIVILVGFLGYASASVVLHRLRASKHAA